MEYDVSLILVIGIFFVIGFLISLSVRTQKKEYRMEKEKRDEFNHYDILEVLETRKQNQIDYLNNKLVDVYTKLDKIESQLLVSQSIPKNQFNSDKIEGVKKQNVIYHDKSHNQHRPKKLFDVTENQNSTIQYILKLLHNEPKTSNEIKNAIGRTREHTSRVMKKLYEMNLVERDVKNRPFRYRLTEAGNKYLHEEYHSDAKNNESESLIRNN
ncbi:MAG TPA: helix-turn-helix domain-containing protein [Nitrososphaeraceae archaeon]|nr:helix-turn-helix domain-containing protein [Nitrososphaeraceae archaeon]